MTLDSRDDAEETNIDTCVNNSIDKTSIQKKADLALSAKKIMNSRNIGNLKIKAETCKHQPNFKITYTSDAFTRSTLRYHF